MAQGDMCRWSHQLLDQALGHTKGGYCRGWPHQFVGTGRLGPRKEGGGAPTVEVLRPHQGTTELRC